MKNDPTPVKRLALGFLLVGVVLIGGYVVMVGVVCLWVGMHSTHRDGFWVPLLAGGLTVAVVLRLVIPAARGLRRALRGGPVGPKLDDY